MKKLILSSLFVLISIVSFSQGFYNRWVPTSGTDTYSTNITSFTSLSNSVIYVKFTNTNTTAATITINGTLGPAPIRAWDGDSWEVLTGGELDVNTIYKLSYQGSYYELEGIGSSSSLGTEGQVPFMNSTDDDFDYSSKFTWDNTNNRLIAGNGTISSGTNNINFGDATTLTGSWSLTSAEESTVRGNNNTSSGWDVTVGDNTNSNSGNGTTTSGIDNINYGIGSYVGGIGGQLSYVSTSQRGGFVHAFSAGSVDGKKPSGVEYLIANDGAFNVSRNTANQTAGHGSLAQDGAILGGINHNIPSTSPRSVIIGGDSIKARASDPDNVYVPYLNVTQMDQDSSLSRILVQNATTKKVHYRSISTMGLESVSVTTTGGTITLDFNSGDNDDAVEKMFIGSNTWATSKTLAFSNSSGKLVFNFHFEVTNVAGEIVCSTCIAAASAVSGTWDSGTDTWTPTETGKYEMGGTWDGSAWKIKIIGPFE